ncbi:hypothetical protein [Reyranella sp.]|jgi:hypothetical protein|uniref:hypothetical protein n=1 Tax=Reyranella sp. TaxID=1929291 RepID=UPI002F954069
MNIGSDAHDPSGPPGHLPSLQPVRRAAGSRPAAGGVGAARIVDRIDPHAPLITNPGYFPDRRRSIVSEREFAKLCEGLAKAGLGETGGSA